MTHHHPGRFPVGLITAKSGPGRWAPPGLGILVFSYNPPGFTAGFAASLAALVILTGLLLAARRAT